MTLIRLLLIVVLGTSPFFGRVAPAQSPDEIEHALKTLRRAGQVFLKLIEDLDEEQWNFKAPSIRHTIGEEAEHVALAENDLQTVIREALKSPKKVELAKLLEGKEKKVREMMLEPEILAENYTPKGKLKTKPEVVEYFTRAHRRAIKTLERTPDLSLHVYSHPHPDYRELTAYQWFYYIAYHNLRHCKQIEVIMADPGFPGGPRPPSVEVAAKAP